LIPSPSDLLDYLVTCPVSVEEGEHGNFCIRDIVAEVFSVLLDHDAYRKNVLKLLTSKSAKCKEWLDIIYEIGCDVERPAHVAAVALLTIVSCVNGKCLMFCRMCVSSLC